MKLVTRELLSRLESVQIPSRRRTSSANRGERQGFRKGSSLEFSDYREYLQGDDFRSIDWNVYARSERLFLKLFLEEENKPLYFIVDCSKSMQFGNPSKLEYALAIAASLSYVALLQYDRPSILLLKNSGFRKIPIHSRSAFFPVLQQLSAALESGEGETHLNQQLRRIAFSRFQKGIYFLISDFYSQDGFDGLKLIGAAGNEMHCLQVLTPEEIHPEMRGDFRLLDSETNESTEISVSPKILKQYSARLKKHQAQVQETAHRSMAGYFAISTAVPLQSLLLLELKKRGLII